MTRARVGLMSCGPSVFLLPQLTAPFVPTKLLRAVACMWQAIEAAAAANNACVHENAHLRKQLEARYLCQLTRACCKDARFA